MKLPSALETAESATNVFAWVMTALFGMIAIGVAVAPVISLPARVEDNEAAIRQINGRLDKSEDKLDILICFHQAQVDGTDPASCSLR